MLNKLMKRSKPSSKTGNYLLIAGTSLLIILVFWIYFITHTSLTLFSQEATRSALIAKRKAQVKAAEEAVKKLESDRSDENLTAAQTLVDQLAAGEKKKALQDRIEAVKLDIANQASIAEAEVAVKFLEDNQADENLTKAQEATDKVINADAKAQFQARIDAVKRAMAAKIAATAAAAAAESDTASANVSESGSSSSSSQASGSSQTVPSQQYQAPAQNSSASVPEASVTEAPSADTGQAVDPATPSQGASDASASE
ncbi:hypothetical protein [Streptococcus ferus]|uniref:hypothetical protein n=1 Tax=Streptococcus ferus TaxID=1345 RepID=UPI002356830A|nr:hypothetical protein [Streptococcus ferus]